MKVKLLKLNENLIYPERGHYNDAGIDCYALEDYDLEPVRCVQADLRNAYAASPVMIPLGFGVELPDGYMAVLKPRSSLNAKGIVTQIGTIDSGYHGEIKAVLMNFGEETYHIKRGDRICQLVVEPVIYADLVEELVDDRGDGGFGSTGK